MKRILRSAGVLLVISALFTPAAQAYLTVTGNGATTAQSFALALSKAVFFRPTGEYYFGQVAGANGNYSLSYASYRNADQAPVLTALGTTAPLLNALIDQLAVVPNSALVTSPTIVSAVGLGANLCTSVSAVSKTVLTPVSQAVNSPATTLTGGIRALTASRSASTGANAVFMAVKVTTGGADATKPFGSGTNPAGGDGTATDGINAALITQTAGVPAFAIGATGAGTNTARAVDLTVGGSFMISDAGVTPITMTATGINPAFCYDEQLQRLYVGIQGTVAANATPSVNGLVGVGIYPVTISGTAVTVGAQLLPAGIPTGTAGADMAAVFSGLTNIVGVSQSNGNSACTILKLQTMHTSTGMPYLIVNGNAGTTTTAGTAVQVAKNIFAVPLVNGTPDATNSVGCFANVQSGDHTLRASAAGDLVVSTSAAAKVGGTGVLPVAFGTSGAVAVTDMYVDNDAVYVATGVQALGTTISSTTETGLWKSQAVFNTLGQIDHWTDWQKVAPNDMGGAVNPGVGNDPRIDFAAVDAYTGHVWTVNNTSLAAHVTQWTQPTATPNSQQYLASAINSALGAACYSVLDLNASTTGWGAAAATQIALFGGQEKVCFAITGSRSNASAANGITTAAAAVNGTYTSLNTVMLDSAFDYTNSFTFITTSLPAGAGAVVSLGFSGWDADANGTTQGFFLAGCAGTTGVAPALYAYTATATNGFNPTTVGLADQPFSTLGLTVSPAGTAGAGSWQKVANISGMPIKIQGFGGGLHVLTRSATIDRIYSCPKVNTLALLNSSFVVTASSGVTPSASATASNLSAVKQIYDFVVSVSAAGNVQPNVATVNGVEQLVMLTNDGIYTTSSLAGMQTSNVSQLNAGWVLVDGTSTKTTNGYFSNYINYPAYNRMPQTFWFANYSANPAIANVYNKNIQYQASRSSWGTAGGGAAAGTLTQALTYSADPTDTATFDGAQSFNSTTAPQIYANFPVLYRLFYNDGARRFFIQKNPSDDTTYQVLVLPYNLYDYNITANGKAPMADAVVAQAGAFYWMAPIGDTGRLMMGTSSGVISLQ